jgi:hypothetical protein
MKERLPKWGIFTAGVALSLVAAQVEPAQAARFTFTLGNTFSSSGSGELFFEQSTLRGIGTETITLFELKQTDPATGFSFFYIYSTLFPNNPRTFVNPPLFDFGTPSNPLFTFSSGQLTGIEYTFSGKPFQFGFNPPLILCTPGQTCSSNGNGSIVLDLLGDRYQLLQSLTAVTTIWTGSTLLPGPTIVVNNQVIDGGGINFTTIEPIEPVAAVPEPSAVMGTGVAIAIAALLKKQRTKNFKQT